MSLIEFRIEIPVAGLELGSGSDEDKKENDAVSISFWGWFYHLGKFITSYLQFDNDRTNTNSDGVVNSMWLDQ